jgi:hypothetical protein
MSTILKGSDATRETKATTQIRQKMTHLCLGDALFESRLSSVSPPVSRDSISNKALDVFFNVLSNLLFINYPIIHHYIALATDSVIK